MPRFFTAAILAAAASSWCCRLFASRGGISGGGGGGVSFFFVVAYPSGAGQCLVGQTSVSSEHLEASSTKTITTGRLAAGRFRLALNGNDLRQPYKGRFHRVKVGTSYTLKIDSTRSVPRGDDLWRGVLLAATPNRTNALFTLRKRANDTALQDAFSCADPTLGVTHTDSNRKRTAVARFRAMNASMFSLDANVVVANNATRSVYYYQQFHIRAVTDCQSRNETCAASLDCCLGLACVNRTRTGSGSVRHLPGHREEVRLRGRVLQRTFLRDGGGEEGLQGVVSRAGSRFPDAALLRLSLNVHLCSKRYCKLASK